IRRRTSDSGLLASRNLRTASRSCSCSSENAKFTVCSLSSSAWFTREPEHPLTDDVALDFARACVDGLGTTEHEGPVQLVQVVLPRGGVVDEHRLRAEDPQRALSQRAMPVAPVQLADARLGSERAALHEAGEHAQAVVLHDLNPDVRIGELLAPREVLRRAA